MACSARSLRAIRLPAAANLAIAPSGIRLGSLSSCVRINLRVEYQYVHIAAGCKYVVEAAIADVVRPTVSPTIQMLRRTR